MIRSLTQACSSGRGGSTVRGRAGAAVAGAGRRAGAGVGAGAATVEPRDEPFFEGEGVNARIN